MHISELPTPALLLDRGRLKRNIATMHGRARQLNVDLRPHLKTAKSADVARLATAGFSGGVTVSTLAEARYLLSRGFRDLTYAVGIVPAKLPEVASLARDGADINILTDSPDVARAITAQSGTLGAGVKVLIEIDTGAGRAGIAPDDSHVIEIAEILRGGGAALAGVLSHAGHSYGCDGIDEIVAVAEEERAGAVRAAQRLRAAGHACPVVSVGSTPTALFAAHLEGVTEMRPGNFVFFDLFQAGLGTCRVEDIAVRVLASVIGHHHGRNHLLLDAGALALSKDVGANRVRPGTGYGAVSRAGDAAPLPGLAVLDVHQEHGMVSATSGLDAIAPLRFADFPLGSRLTVWPNHSCMTAAMYDRYFVTDGGDTVVDTWDRINGW